MKALQTCQSWGYLISLKMSNGSHWEVFKKKIKHSRAGLQQDFNCNDLIVMFRQNEWRMSATLVQYSAIIRNTITIVQEANIKQVQQFNPKWA